MVSAACSGIALHIMPFTIKHPLKKKIHGTAPNKRFIDHASTVAFCEKSYRPATDRYYLPPIVFLAIQLVKYQEVCTKHNLGKAPSNKQYKGEQEYEERKFKKSPTNENYRTTSYYS